MHTKIKDLNTSYHNSRCNIINLCLPQIKKKDIDLMAKNLWHTKALINICKHFNYIKLHLYRCSVLTLH